MKKTIFSTILAFAFTIMAVAQSTELATVNVSSSNVSAEGPQFNWEFSAYDFGKIPQGKPVTIIYHFTNTGNAVLIISNVNPSCGCTGANFTKEPIAPGKKGFVEVTFNAAALGNFSKSLSVIANTSTDPIVLTFKGEVIPDATKSIISN